MYFLTNKNLENRELERDGKEVDQARYLESTGGERVRWEESTPGITAVCVC